MSMQPQNIFSLVVLVALIQALRDGVISQAEFQQLLALIVVASVLPQLAIA